MKHADLLRKKCQTIHVARRQLDLDDATYRALLVRAAGVTSSRDLKTVKDCDAVLDELSRLGFKHRKPTRAAGAPATLGREPMLQKIEALLADMQLPWAYADTIAEHVTGGKAGGVKRLAWVREAKHLTAIIAALHKEKVKRLKAASNALGVRLAELGLTPEWARAEAEAQGRLMRPWPWYECLETLRLIDARLDKLAA